MTSRRRNLFVIALTLGLLVASIGIMITKETKLGLDLKGGVELVYQGEPTPQSKVTPEAIDRAIDIIRERVDRLGVAEPEIQRLGSDQISVGLPGVKNLERAKKQVGTTAQLSSIRLGAQRHRQPADADRRPLPGGQARVPAAAGQGRQQLHDRHLLPLQAEQAARGRARRVARGPAVGVRREGPQGLRDSEGPRGHRGAAGGAAGEPSLRRAVRALLRRARQPGGARYRPEGPAPGERPDDARADRDVQVHGQGPQELPRGHPPPGRAGPDPPDPGPAGGELVPDVRDRAGPRGRSRARSSTTARTRTGSTGARVRRSRAASASRRRRTSPTC